MAIAACKCDHQGPAAVFMSDLAHSQITLTYCSLFAMYLCYAASELAYTVVGCLPRDSLSYGRKTGLAIKKPTQKNQKNPLVLGFF